MYLNFKEYKLNNPNNCESNYIDVYNDKLSDSGREHRFCGTQAESVRSKTNQMNIRFFAKHDALQNVQFEITFTAFRELNNKGIHRFNIPLISSIVSSFGTEQCRSDEFDCEDSTCIDLTLKCDGYDNCKYRYDEDKQTTCAPSIQFICFIHLLEFNMCLGLLRNTKRLYIKISFNVLVLL